MSFFLVQKFSLAHPRPPFSLKPSPKPGFDQQCIPFVKNVRFDGSFNVSGLRLKTSYVSLTLVHLGVVGGFLCLVSCWFGCLCLLFLFATKIIYRSWINQRNPRAVLTISQDFVIDNGSEFDMWL